MPRIGVVGQGSYDRAIVSALVKRCLPGVIVEARQCRGPVPGKVAGIIKEFATLGIVDSVLIVSDAEREPAEVVTKRIKDRLPRGINLPIEIIIAVQELEAWLLADPSAIKQITGRTVRYSNPETIQHPKSELRRILSKGNVRYTEAQGEWLASMVDLELTAKRCPSFAAFRRAVKPSVPTRGKRRQD